jgi:hypothetical protein
VVGTEDVDPFTLFKLHDEAGRRDELAHLIRRSPSQSFGSCLRPAGGC